MKKVFLLLCTILIAGSLWAESESNASSSSEVISEIIGEEVLDKTIDELTLEERLALNDYYSVKRQERFFIRSTAVTSFFLPGVGNIIAGDTWGGILHIALEAAIAGGTITGAYFFNSRRY